MCGIVAIFSRRTPVPTGVVEKATKSLHHRGPDGQRHWISPDSRTALGHARLSIIDLTTGDQPIANEDERLRIIVNGEFYGYESIQTELEGRGHRLRTRSDSEIALHLYEELGVDCLRQLRGEFALVIWDSVNRRIFAARDRFGIKPLFYSLHEGTLYLASEIKALFAAGVPARWDREIVYDSVDFGASQARTLFKDVFQVPPGHFMVATEEDIKLARYWDFDYPESTETSPQRSDAEYSEEFRHTLDESIRLRLRADVPVGCYLSGGIDSCAVLGLAARHHPEPIRAFTLTFDRPEYNEGEIAREMAAKAQAQFFPIPIKQDDLADHFGDAIHQAETFCVNGHGVAKFLLSRAVRDLGYKVVITGEGSDEILGGYMHFRRDMNFHKPTIAAVNGSGPALDAVNGALGFVPGWVETAISLSTKMHAVLSKEFMAESKGRLGFANFIKDVDVPGQLTGRHPLHQSLYLWSKTRLPNYILTLLGDRMEMAHSIEGRVPFLDHRLVELMRSQPVTQKIRGVTQKYILRESVRDVITDTVYRRHKHPFLSPPATLNQQSRFNMLLQDTLRGPALTAMPFFDAPKVLNLLDGLYKMDEASRVANDQVLMTLLSACVLQDRFQLSV